MKKRGPRVKRESQGVGNRTFNEDSLETSKSDDQHLLSWIGWEYKPYYPMTGAGYGMFNKDGTVNDEMLATLRRPYASAVAGQTISQFFDEQTLDYELLFLANEVTNTQTSMLYVP